MELIQSVLLVITTIMSGIALALSISSHNRGITKTYLDFLKECDSEEQRHYRQTVYQCISDGVKIEDLPARDSREIDVANIVSFYNKWATLYYKGFLPKWTFEDSEGQTLAKMYYILKKYIKNRREEIIDVDGKKINNDKYGDQFEKLAIETCPEDDKTK